MKPVTILAVGAVALGALTPAAFAGTVDASTDAPPAAPTTTTTTTTTEPPATTTTTPPATTTTVPSTTTTTVPTTTDVPATTTTTDPTGVGGDGTDGGLIPDDEMAVDCIDATCAPVSTAGSGVVPTAVGAGVALPFTGIEDVVAPILLSLVVLLAGIVAIRWAQLREDVARIASRRIINGAGVVTRTGYAGALREQQITARARRFYEPRVA